MNEDDPQSRSLSRMTRRGSPGGHGSCELLPELQANDGDGMVGANAATQRMFSPWQLLRYKWSILSVFLLVATLTIGGIWSLIIPQYKAKAMIEVFPIIPQLLTAKSEMVPLYESFRGTQGDYIKTAAVLNATLDDPKIRQTRWYQALPASPLEALLDRLNLRNPRLPLDRLRDALTVEIPKGKQSIFVSMTATTPGEAKLILDKVIIEYEKYTSDRASTSDKDRMDVLRDQIKQKDLELLGLDNDAARLRRKLGTTIPDDVVRQRALNRLELESKINSLKTEIGIETRMLELLQENSELPGETPDEAVPDGADASTPPQESTPEPTPESVAIQQAAKDQYILNPRWQMLNDRLAATESEIRLRAARYGEQDKQLMELRRTQEKTTAEIRILEAQLDKAGGTATLDLSSPAVLQKSINDKQIELEGLTKQLEQDQQTSVEYLEGTEDLIELNVNREKVAAVRQQLQDSFDQRQMNSQVAGSVRPFMADEPGEPENDKRWKLTIAALFGSLALAVGLAFLRIKLSPTVDQVVEIALPARNAFLGYMPLVPKPATESLENCPPQLESVRLIRTALLNRLNGARGVAVQITSATLGSGKSTLANALARSFAQGGKTVLLVDADMRRPSLAARFAIKSSPGLQDILANPRSEIEGICQTNVPGLDILPAGSTATHAERELLANGLFSGLINRWRERYDLVLFDGAPLLGPADAAILAGGVDGTILVVRERHDRREAVLESLAVLSAAGGRLFGTVFVGSGNHSGYGYGYGYDYGSAEPMDASDVPDTTDHKTDSQDSI